MAAHLWDNGRRIETPPSKASLKCRVNVIMRALERLDTAFALQLPDRPPILGGWLAAPEHIQSLTGCNTKEYWEDPFYWGLEAERALGSDGVITIFEPIAEGEYRCVDGRVLEEQRSYSVEGVRQYIRALPELAQLEAAFDEEQRYRKFIGELEAKQAQCGEIVWCPANWYLIPRTLWVYKFGYESALMTMATYPDEYRKLIHTSAIEGRQKAILRARAIREGLLPAAVLTGEDLCSQRGPIVSPAYLRKEYFPLLEHTLEPLLDVGAKIIWHCDGDYRQLLPDVLACGVNGLQGFQEECGMDLEMVASLRARNGDPLLILGPLSVTRTLPFGTTAEVRAEVHRAMNIFRDNASLVFFTSNTITPDVPLENVKAFWDEVHKVRW
jgi:hypothetical protein